MNRLDVRLGLDSEADSEGFLEDDNEGEHRSQGKDLKVVFLIELVKQSCVKGAACSYID